MLRNSMTVVLERDGIAGPNYRTEPYEVAWAIEARWFVRTLGFPDGVDRVELTTQISPDGLHWCDLDEPTQGIDGEGVVSFSSCNFGGWLRLRASVIGEIDTVAVPALIYLALKG